MQKVKNKGFSFIELMVVIAIVGILASIAVPSYSSYLVNARRADGQIGLRNAAQIMERCRTQNFSYEDCNDNAPAVSPDGYYSLEYSITPPNKYTLTATPIAGKSQANDAKCKTLTLDQTGATGSTPSPVDDCW